MSPVADKVANFFKQYPSKTYQAGQLLLFAGEPVTLVTYLQDGVVGQYDIAESGNKSIVTIYKPGAFFPMNAVVNNHGNKYFCEALGDVTVRQAPAQEVLDFLQRQPDVAFDLLQRVYRGMDGLIGRMLLLMNGSAQSRLLYELMILAERFGKSQTDGWRLVEVTESQLAAQTGLARETISRNLQKLAQSGTVKLAKGGVQVRLAR